ncbi:MAG: hypothetical protein JXA28_06175 [Bacteroidetes bacterium]|nr:hypothetical protein [Bacteroidota bacterium]
MAQPQKQQQRWNNANPTAGWRKPILLVAALFACALLLPAGSAAQEHALQDLSNQEFLSFVRTLRNPQAQLLTGQSVPLPQGEKCGLGVSIEAARRMPTMEPDMAAELHSLLSPQARQVSILSPSGKFRIHFDTTGYHEPALLDQQLNRILNTAWAYADSVAKVFDEVYRIEVEEFGFDPPPFRTGEAEYQITILEFLGHYYGQTLFNVPLPNSGTVRSCYATHMEIDNDFLRYETKGMDGLRVTAAHEYHHMVQLGTYGLWDTDRWVHEMTSTYFEQAVYPFIEDYLQYLPTFMLKTDLPMYAWSPDGYELVLWPLFLEKKYDVSIMREIWEGMRRHEPVTAMRDAIRDHQPGGDIEADFCSWTAHNYFTGYRAGRKDPNIYDDAGRFPSIKPTAVELVAEAATLTGTLLPLSSTYVRVFRGLDSLTFVISNSDIPSAISRSGAGVSYELTVRSQGYDGSYMTLSNGWAYKFTASAPNALCVSLLEGGSAAVVERDAPFPNPFYPRENARMQFPIPRNVSANRADLFLYTVSMNKVFGREGMSIELDDITGAHVAWDGRGDNGDFLSTGIYFYHLKYGGETITGKIAVVAR